MIRRCSCCGKRRQTIEIEKIGGSVFLCHECFMKSSLFEGEYHEAKPKEVKP